MQYNTTNYSQQIHLKIIRQVKGYEVTQIINTGFDSGNGWR